MNSADFQPFTAEDVVIHAEDEMFSRFMMNEMLNRLGKPKVVGAPDGTEAEAVLRAASPALKLVILDFQMPGRNGLQILKDLRCGRLGVRRDIPVIMVSAVDSSGLVAAAATLDIDGFALKPASLQTIQDMLRTIFERSPVSNPVKRTDVYEAVDIEAIVRMTSRPEQKNDKAKPVSVRDLVEGMVLACDVGAPNGALLVARGTRIKERLVCLLRGLAAGGLPLEPIWIETE